MCVFLGLHLINFVTDESADYIWVSHILETVKSVHHNIHQNILDPN